MKHIHEFAPQPPGTLMFDLLSFRAPLGLLGSVAEKLILTRYMRGLLLIRNSYLKQVAETNAEP
jgi:ligand-binding SRPBCC domain-containing protein